MADAAIPNSTLPVPLSAYGPLHALHVRVHELSNIGRFAEVLAAADAYEALATAAGDEKTVGFLRQSRMYAYQHQGHHQEALAAGEELLRGHRAAGNVVGEAKALADLSWSFVVTGQIVDGMRYLARSGMLLNRAEPRGERYLSALTSYSTTAWVAELYEIANVGYERIAELCPPVGRPDLNSPYDVLHMEVLLRWGLRLDQIDQGQQAHVRLRRCAGLAQRWLIGYSNHDGMHMRIRSYRALALAKLGQLDEAVMLAESAVTFLREHQMDDEARLAHLALGIALGGRGEPVAANRELLAAQQLLTSDSCSDDRLIVAYERAVLAARIAGDEAGRIFLDALGEQVRQLWQLRLQRLAMLRQAREREELEAAHARIETALLVDPLTGLGNRLRFDRLMAAIDAGQLPHPTSLLVIDVDRFKTINDTYSHSVGDQVLCAIGAILRANCRSQQDIAVRYAGDEFTVFLHADLPAALDVAHRVTAALRATDLSHLTPGTQVSLSVGVALLLPGMTAKELFHLADQNLYQAKRGGRDRVAAA